MPNPVPKPASQSRQPNRGIRARRAVVTTPRTSPPKPPKDLQGPGRDWYESLKSSRQSGLYEDSDWHTAIAAGFALSEAFDRTRPPSHRERHHREWRQLAESLLASEKARRSVHFHDDDAAPGSPDGPPPDHAPRVGGRGAAM
ncbi:MAG: hypothetical protein V9E98_02060 [Candidatus Nanopelagicales bacterium]